jgi:hypothetical protein
MSSHFQVFPEHTFDEQTRGESVITKDDAGQSSARGNADGQIAASQAVGFGPGSEKHSRVERGDPGYDDDDDDDGYPDDGDGCTDGDGDGEVTTDERRSR